MKNMSMSLRITQHSDAELDEKEIDSLITIDSLSKEISKARSLAKTFYDEFKSLESQANNAKGVWEVWKNKAEALDYQLALLDGRLQVIKPNVKTKVRTKPIKLTMAQILHVAEVLGITLDEGK
jgi:hypothetical protein